MVKETPRISGKEARKQLERVKLKMGKDIYDRLAVKFAKAKVHKTS